jgi:hypothetical protein
MGRGLRKRAQRATRWLLNAEPRVRLRVFYVKFLMGEVALAGRFLSDFIRYCVIFIQSKNCGARETAFATQ